MSEYLRFDMSELRRDIGLAVRAETERIEKESAEKVQGIQEGIQRIAGLRRDFVVPKAQTAQLDPHRLSRFNEQSEESERLAEGEREKQALLRQEVRDMEIELRRLKESLNEIRGENARFKVVIAKEEQLR